MQLKMKYKRFLSLLMAMAMMLSLLPAGALAVEQPEQPEQPVAEEGTQKQEMMLFSTQPTAEEGDETEETNPWNPDTSWYNDTNTEFVLTTAEQLAGLDKLVEGGNRFEGKTIKLGADINLYIPGEGDEPVSFSPIGANAAYFKGTFDGQNHIIANMYQSGWALGFDLYNYGTIGLFSYLWDATVKNLTIANAECFVEGGCVAAIAGSAWGDCTFENIKVVNSTFATYNNRCAGIVGYTGGEGCFTFKDITIDEDTVIAGLWGSFDSTLGGVMGQLQEESTVSFEDVNVSCRLDAYNDVTASYKWYSYRMCGMLIGRVDTVKAIEGTGSFTPDPENAGVTIGDNVVVNFGDWADYTYLWADSLSRGCQRVEPGYQYGGVNVEDYPDAQIDYIPFDAIFGGPQSQKQGYYGLAEYEGVKVTFPAVAEIDGEGFRSIADAVAVAEDGDTITIVKDEVTLPDSVIVDKSVTLDLNGMTITGDVTPAFRITDGANVTVENGTMDVDGYCFILGAQNEDKTYTAGNLTIESGTYKGETSVASVTKGTLTITGGSFSVEPYQGNYNYLLNCIDANYKNGTAKIVVKGGTFYNYDPAGNAAEGQDTSFLHKDYVSNKIAANTYQVVPNLTKLVAKVVDKDNNELGVYGSLTAAVAAAQAGNTVVLMTDVTEDAAVNKSVTIDGAGFKYTGNIAVSGTSTAATVKNVNFVDGTYYAIKTDRIKSITVEDCTVTDYDYGFLYANKSTPTVVVKNVTVDGAEYGFHWAYGTKATLESVKMTNVAYGIMTQNYGAKTITLTDCSIEATTPISVWERNTTVTDTFNFVGTKNTLSTTNADYTVSAQAKLVLTDKEATLTAPAGLNVTTSVDGMKVIYADGVYKVAPFAYVAQIGEGDSAVKYESLADAIKAAAAGDTITLLANITEDVTVNKSVTIDGAGFKYTGNISVSGTSTAATVKNVNFVDGTGYAITTNRIKSITVENCTVANYGYGFLYANKSTPTVVVKNVSVEGGNYGFHWVYGTTVTLENVKMTNIAYGIMTQNYGAKTITLTDCSIEGTNPIYIWERNTTVTDTFNFVGTNNTLSTTNEDYTVSAQAKLVLTDKGATLKAPEGLNVTTTVADCVVNYADGTYSVGDYAYVAQIVGGGYYGTLADAIAAAKANDTIKLLADITEDVTVNKNLTIDGAGFKYTGNISASGTSTAATVKNVNFVDGTGYAIKTDRIKSITVENCTVTDYDYGFLYANKSTPTVVVKNVTVDGAEYGFHWAYGTKATLENVKMTNVVYGIMTQNYGAKTITLTGCSIEATNPIYVWERNTTVTDTYNFVGTENTLSTTNADYTVSAQAKLVLTDEDATLTAPAGLNVTTPVAGMKVVYENGMYKVVDKVFVAQIGETQYESLQDAINAAADGAIIEVIADHELTGADVQTEKNFGYQTLIIVDGKAVTIDFAGHTVTVKHGDPANYSGEKDIADCLEAVVFVYDYAGLTLTDSTEGAKGGFDVPADDNVSIYSMVYNCGGKLTVEDGTYNIEKGYKSASLIYAENNKGTHTTAVAGGKLTVGNAGENNDTKPWIFNTEGKNSTFITVTGGTYNQDILMNYGTGRDCEAKVPETHYVKDNGDRTWTVKEGAVAQRVDADGKYIRSYGSIAEALSAAMTGETVQLLQNVKEDVILFSGMRLDLNGNTLTAKYAVGFDGASIVDDSTDKTGLLKITKTNLSLAAGNEQMPLWNGEGYVFATMNMQGQASRPDDNTFSCSIRPSFGKSFNSTYLADGAKDNGVSIILRVNWTAANGDARSQDFVFAEDMVKDVYTNGRVFVATLRGLSGLEYTVDMIVESDVGVICSKTI